MQQPQIRPTSSGIVLTVSLDQLGEIAAKAKRPLAAVRRLIQVVDEYAELAQHMAVENVSGRLCVFNGHMFVINRVTGKLARSIKVFAVTPIAKIVMATAEYADYIEAGVNHPVDMKPYLMGKVVPIRFARAQVVMTGAGAMTRGKNIMFPVAGNSRQGPTPVAVRPKFASTGRKTRDEFLIFRKVTPRSRGWIIPPRLPRPFMRAVAEAITPKFQAAAMKAYADYLTTE